MTALRFTETEQRYLWGRPFLPVWLGRFTSAIGTAMYSMAIAYWARNATHNVMAMGLLSAASAIGNAAMSLFGGFITDRHIRRRVLITANLVAGLTTAIPPLLLFYGQLSLHVVYAVGLITGACSGILTPTYLASIPEMVPRPLLHAANSRMVMASSLAMVIGPAAGGALIGSVGPAWTLSANAASYWFAVIGLAIAGRFPYATVNRHRDDTSPSERGGYLGEIGAGLRVFGTDAALGWILGLSAALNLAFQTVIVLLPVLVLGVLRATPGTYGLVSASLPVGMLLGALLSARTVRRLAQWREVFLVFVGYPGMTFLGLALLRMIPGTMLLLVTTGVATATTMVAAQSIIQVISPQGLRGRVFAIINMVSWVSQLIAYLGAGAAGSVLGAPPVIGAAGVMIVMTALAGYVMLPAPVWARLADALRPSEAEAAHAGSV